MDYIIYGNFNANDDPEINNVRLSLPNDKWVKRSRKLMSRRWRAVNRKMMNEIKMEDKI